MYANKTLLSSCGYESLKCFGKHNILYVTSKFNGRNNDADIPNQIDLYIELATELGHRCLKTENWKSASPRSPLCLPLPVLPHLTTSLAPKDGVCDLVVIFATSPNLPVPVNSVSQHSYSFYISVCTIFCCVLD